MRINNLKYIGLEEFTAENQIFLDFAMWLGRVISCIAIIVIGLLNLPILAFAVLISISFLMYVIVPMLLFHLGQRWGQRA